MATVPVDAQQDELATTDNVASESELSQNLEQSPSNVDKEPAQDDDSRSLRIYSRPQLLALSKSPLVCVPPDMPELKEWFGFVMSFAELFSSSNGIKSAENEQNLSKKDSEPTTPNSGRERR
ncbi:hypothetical protein BDP27DRAFT_328753 [Rhodocollybia butyracea]|uniref:Uncharacterized protein n=1 Tax=Rhodocollybia butyracea TaxID=206335 RepID=A0A9P5PF64_9AGAR|nr:hypothetical protein BDP27DRAFT_328753 [Rhodocollybia butyracea]